MREEGREAARTQQVEELGEKLLRYQWKTGLTAYLLPRRGYLRKYASLTAGFGSVDLRFSSPEGREYEVPAGVAHFLEHKMFEDPEEPVFERFSRWGAQANAFTSYEITSYLFSCVDGFWESLDLLLDFVQEAHFTPRGVEKEKPIIEQEIRMGLDSPQRTVLHNLRRLLFRQHPVREEVAGTLESVRAITYDHLEWCYRAFYHPSNLVLFVAGDLEPEAVLERVDRDQAGRQPGPPPGFHRKKNEEPAAVVAESARERMAVAVPLLALGYKDPCWSAASTLTRRVAGEMALELLVGRGSDLYHRLYREGLIDDSFAGSYACGRDWAFTVFLGRTRDPVSLAERLREGLSSARAGWESTDLERCRRASRGQFVSLFDSLEAPGQLVSELHFYGGDLFDYWRVLAALEAEDVRAYLEEALAPERVGVSLVLPA